MDKQRLVGGLEMSAAMVISGSIGFFVLKSGQPVTNVVFFRCLFGAVTLGLVCWALGLLKPGLMTRRILMLAILGGVAIVLNWFLLFAAYARASISIATTVYNTQPFMLVGLSALVFREKITLRQVLWLGLAFAGMLAIVQVEPGTLLAPGEYGFGIVLSLAAALLYAISTLLTKRLTGVAPHLIALIHTVVGTLMLAPFLDWQQLPLAIWQWSPLLTLGVVHTGLQYALLYGAVQKLPTPVIGALSFIYPVVAIFVDWWAFGQSLGLVQVIGIAVILFAAAGLNLGWGLPAFRKTPTQPVPDSSRPGQ